MLIFLKGDFMRQLFTVDTKERLMYVYEDDKLVRTISDVWIGRNGVSTFEEAIEFDEKTPLGLFNLGVSFGIHNMNIKYPYIKIDKGSFWVDDYKSSHYNYFVEIGKEVNNFNYPYIVSLKEKDFNSAEHLIDYKQQYEYAIFIEYNASGQIDENGIGNNKGSAIFLHCHGNKGYTGGCVAISRDNMLWIMNYIDRNKNPKILIK